MAKVDSKQISLTIGDISASARNIPFPAVTLCTETKSRQRVFNFTKAFKERWSIPSEISVEELKLHNDMLLVCNNPRNDGPDFADASSIETLRRVAPSHEEIFFKCRWGNYSCNDLFFHTVTKDGICYSFNMISTKEMFRVENLHTDYSHTGVNNKSTWSFENTSTYNAVIDSYPFRGLVNRFDITLLTDIRDMDPRCRGPVQGFKIWLHNSAELPHMGQNFVRLPINYESYMMITARATFTSDRLLHYPPSKRRCFFSHERYLRFFRIYTEKNCQFECETNHTALRCGCVPLYMPHGPNTKVCGGGKNRCIKNALEELSIARSQLYGQEFEVETCNCLPNCIDLVYEAEISQGVYNTAAIKEEYREIADKWQVPSGLIISFASDKFVLLRRKQLYGIQDFIASCGGIMGLFIGFSLLSLIEIVFYFTLRLWCVLRKTRITNLSNENQRRIDR